MRLHQKRLSLVAYELQKGISLVIVEPEPAFLELYPNKCCSCSSSQDIY